MIKISIIDKKTGLPLSDSDILNYSKPIKRAIYRTINRVTAGSITDVKREVRKIYTLPYRTLGDNIFIKRNAFEDSLYSIIDAKGKPLSIKEFKYNIQNKTVYNISTRHKVNRQIVSVEIIKGQRKEILPAFQLGNDGPIMKRVGGKLKLVRGISVSGAFNEVQQVIVPQSIRTRWGKEFSRQLNFSLSKE